MSRLVGAVFAVLLGCARTSPLERFEKPVAVITLPDSTLTLGRAAAFDGSSSFDPHGEPLSFRWTLREVPPLAAARLATLHQAETSLTPDRDGLWVIELVVNAGTRDSEPATALLTVTRPLDTNRAPTARVVRITNEPGLVELDASQSTDPDGDFLSYSWRVLQQPAGSAMSLTPAGGEFVRAPVLVTGTYRFELTVDDHRGGTDTDLITLPLKAAAVVDAGVPDAGPVGLDVLNPDEVYILGTLSDGASWRDALAHWSTPNVAAAGFGNFTREDSAMIRPTDGRLLYFESSERDLKAFVCDLCPALVTDPIPSQPALNDPSVAMACAGRSLRDFKVGPNGEVWSQCEPFDSPWRAPPGSPTSAAVNDLLAVGNRVLLTTTHVIDLDTGVLRQHAVSNIVAARWKSPASFLAVSRNTMTTVTTLWEISFDHATQLGVFPPFPPNTRNTGRPTLDARGALFDFGRDTSVPSGQVVDLIVRRDIDGGSTVVYSEATNPVVKIHLSDLVTGP